LAKGLEITADHQSIIGKKLSMISGKTGFTTRESHNCRSVTLGTLFQVLGESNFSMHVFQSIEC
jgi:uncharacterized protein YaiE (UPF0345 family)